MLNLKRLSKEEALNRLSLVANSLAHLSESEATGLGSALALLATTVEDCLAALDPQPDR
jgi:hypothetical protein